MRNYLYDSHCVCGHVTRFTPHTMQDGLYPGVKVSEWRLIGPNLASLIVHLHLRFRLSVSKNQEFLREVIGIPLSVGVLQQCYEEAAVSAVPLEDKLVDDLLADTLSEVSAVDSASGGENSPPAELPVSPSSTGAAAILHMDETPWYEHGKLLWLWVFITQHTVCYWIGHRTSAILKLALGLHFYGWIMSDGYATYRSFPNRLRCWAHLIRKAKGLIECLNPAGQTFGLQVSELMGALKDDIVEWRKLYPDQHFRTEEIANKFRDRLEQFHQRCLINAQSGHKKTAELAKEFLNDWEAIFRVIFYPAFPMTNNEAERALRHWVLYRRFSYGTKSETGSRSLALLASVIDTCRLRRASSLTYMASVIRAARTGKTHPPLPARVGV